MQGQIVFTQAEADNCVLSIYEMFDIVLKDPIKLV